MRARLCLGVGILLFGVMAWPVARSADKPVTPASSSSAPAAAKKASTDPDDDLDDLDEEPPAIRVTTPEQPATRPEPAASSVPEAVPIERPDQYEIQRGDTLWGISSRFWGDPYFWPTLWSYNPYIGNAHLIYPGNALQFNPGNYVRPPSMEFADEGRGPTASSSGEAQETMQPEVVATTADRACATGIPFLEKKGPIEVRTAGFIREEGFGPRGEIVKAPDNKILLSDKDLVYIKFARMADIQCGDTFTIYKPIRARVKHPIFKRRVIGNLYRTLGEVKIVDVNDFVATGRISVAYTEIYRGDLITDHIPLTRQVPIKASSRELEGFIVAPLNEENSTLSTDSVLYIDRGEEDGVSTGDSFYVVRQGDATEGLVGKGEKDFTLPYQVIGKVVVTVPGALVSEAVVTEAVQDLEVGDRITTQVN